MNFAHSEEQQMFAETMRNYAIAKLQPDYRLGDRGQRYQPGRLAELARLGAMGLRIPESFGGTLSPYVMLGIAAEEISRGDFNYSLFVWNTALAADLLVGFGAEDLKERWLPGMAAGEHIIAFGLTEPEAGSDASSLQTSAIRRGESYVITGEKVSITFAGCATACILFARTSESAARGVSCFWVPLEIDGVTRTVYESPGERLTQRGSIHFNEVQLPASHRLGEEGDGFRHAMNLFDYNRSVVALACIGAAEQSLDETIDYVKHRVTFGKPLAMREAVAFQIAEHLSLIRAARLVAYDGLWRRDQGMEHAKEAAMAKWLGPKFSVEAIHTCLLLHGHYGYSQDMPFEQRLRDVIGLEIGDGTPEIMKGIIAREVIGKEYASYR